MSGLAGLPIAIVMAGDAVRWPGRSPSWPASVPAIAGSTPTAGRDSACGAVIFDHPYNADYGRDRGDPPLAWGSPTAIPQLLGIEPTGEPAAELWLGAHPDDPAQAPALGSTLNALIADDPVALLGPAVVKRFGPHLPFLLKVDMATYKAEFLAHHYAPVLPGLRAGPGAPRFWPPPPPWVIPSPDGWRACCSGTGDDPALPDGDTRPRRPAGTPGQPRLLSCRNRRRDVAMSEPDQPAGDIVELRVPADGSYISVMRTVTAALAARCELTLDEIEDLRIAVDEACSLLLPSASAASDLHARFSLTTGCLEVVARVAVTGDTEIDRGGFAWTLLQTLATTVTVSKDDGDLVIALVKQREASEA